MDSQTIASRSKGFALVAALAIMAFVLLLLMSLSVFVRVEQIGANENKLKLEARQNALLALGIAIGQLQKHTGPDQRVTATADLQPLEDDPTVDDPTTDPVSGVELNVSPDQTASTLDAINAYWRDSRNRRWVGVWKNAMSDEADYNSDEPWAFNPVPELQAWLISGSELANGGWSPQDQVAELTYEELISPLAATATFGAANSPYRLLVGPGTVEIASAEHVDRAVVAPQVAIQGSASTVGNYAWWIGDEGLKARADMSDPYYSDSATDTESRIRLQSAQRPAVEVMTSDGVDGFARLDPKAQLDIEAFQSKLSAVASQKQLGLLVPGVASFGDELKGRFHEYSIFSRGVLSDAKRGGLKADLTYLFGQPTRSDFRTALNAAYGDENVAPDALRNRVFKPETTLYATFPDTELSSYYHFADDGGNTGIFEYAPTWEQLWSFANMGNLVTDSPAGVFDGAGNAVPRRHTGDQHGIYPILIQFKLFYRLRIVGGSAETDPDGTVVNRTGRIWSDVMPVVLIANPYSVPLAPADYQLMMDDEKAPALMFGSAEDDGSFDVNNFYRPASQPSAAPKASAPTNYRAIYNLRTNGMAPGEAQIFTVDETNPGMISQGAYSLLPYENGGRQFIQMKNDLDTLTGMTWDTGQSIPDEDTHVALRGWQPAFNARMYMDQMNAPDTDDSYLIQLVRGQNTNTSENNSGSAYFILNPMSDGIRQGGGYYMLLNQPPIQEGAAPGYFSDTWVPQQAPFLQVNYRGMFVFFGGSDSGTGGQNAVEWARAFAKNGSNGQAGTTPSPWVESNLIRDPGDYKHARWGLFNMGEGSSLTEAPSYISDAEVGYQNLLYDIPRPEHPLATMGQLQHFNTTGFVDVSSYSSPDNPARQARVLHSWQSNYAISNSYPQPRVSRERLFDWHNKMGRQFDGSYLWNDILWDRFYFSTYPQSAGFDFDDPDDRLINARYKPFRDANEVAVDEPENFRGDGDPANAANARIAASNLLVHGAFNINSTSVEAWKAVFSSLKNVPIAGKEDNIAPFSRTLVPFNDSTDVELGNTVNSWTGFYDFSEADIQALAEEVVLQIRQRGPFTSLAEFVNRRLAVGRSSNLTPSIDTMGLGLSGALQAALDAVVNQIDDLAYPFDMQAKRFVGMSSGQASHNATRDPDYRLSSGMAGFPGYVLQGDVLSALGASLSARSDTFVIRTYGDAVNPVTGNTDSRAWLEAVVQRVPDYVDDSDAPTEIPAAGTVNDQFGRRYEIVSICWLNQDEI